MNPAGSATFFDILPAEALARRLQVMLAISASKRVVQTIDAFLKKACFKAITA